MKSSYPKNYQPRITSKHTALAGLLMTIFAVLLLNLLVGPLNHDLTAWHQGLLDGRTLSWVVLSSIAMMAISVIVIVLVIRAYTQRPVAGTVIEYGVIRTTIDGYEANGNISGFIGAGIFWARLRPRGYGNVIRFVYLTGNQYRWLKKSSAHMSGFDPQHVDRIDDVLLSPASNH